MREKQKGLLISMTIDFHFTKPKKIGKGRKRSEKVGKGRKRSEKGRGKDVKK
jgi:hypothetical protein